MAGKLFCLLNPSVAVSCIDVRNTTRSGEVRFTGCQTTDYQEEFLATDLEESGISEDHE
jgi:hypothetical protein